MKNQAKMILIILSVVLGACAVFLSIHIYQATPFFELNLVFLDVVLILVTAALFATAMMAPCD